MANFNHILAEKTTKIRQQNPRWFDAMRRENDLPNISDEACAAINILTWNCQPDATDEEAELANAAWAWIQKWNVPFDWSDPIAVMNAARTKS